MQKIYIRPLLLWWCLLAAGLAARAQPGGWTVKSSDFQFSMNMVAQIETGGTINQALDNHVAAFSNGEIRGYGTPVWVNGQAYYFLNIYSNTYLGDQIYFLAFIGAENKVYESTDTVAFLHHNLIGDLLHPQILHFTLSPRPLIYSLANINYFETNCTPGPLVDVQASDDEDSEGNGLKYHITGGVDSSRFRLDSLTGVLNWKNFTPDFEHPVDLDSNNVYLVDVQVVDHAGNSSVQHLAVTVKDDPPPAATCPPAIAANTSDNGKGDCTTTVTGALSVGTPGGCATYPISFLFEGATTGQGTGQVPLGQLFAAGLTTVRYTVADDSGTKSSACSFTVTVTDDEPPTLNCPGNLAVDTDPGGCTAQPAGTGITLTDNCPDTPVSFSLTGATTGSGTGQVPANQLFAAGVTTVTYSVSTGAGQPDSTCSFTVTVTDNELPTLSCRADTLVNLSSGCNTAVSGIAATVSDNCNGFVLAYQLTGATTGSGTGQVPGGEKFQAGVTTVVYTATDSDGTGQRSCSFTITVLETVRPSLTCPASPTIKTGSGCMTTLADYRSAAQVSDNCTADTAIVLVQQPAPGTMLNGLGATSVQLTATDGSGNARSCSFTVTVEDNAVLQITCPPAQQVCTGAIGNYASLANVVTGCSMGTPSVSQSPLPGAPIAVNGQTTVTLTANDGVRTASCMVTVTRKDTIAPTAFCQNAMVALQANSQATISADAVNNNSTDNCGVQGVALDKTMFTCSNLGNNIVTLTVTDVNGLTSTCTATVLVTDPGTYCCAAPVAACKPNLEVWLNSSGQAQLAASDIDNSSSAGCGLQSISVNPATLNCTQIGTTLSVTLTVTDLTSRISTCSSQVTVRDTLPPTISCPPNQTVAADGSCSGTVGTWAAATKSDNCTASGSIAVVQSPAMGTVLSGHGDTRTVTLTATDGSLNSSSCSFSVTLKDMTPPTVVCKDTTVNLQDVPNVGVQAAIVGNDVFASGSDNCGSINLGVSPNVFTCAQRGNNVVTLTATDQYGNSKTCQATVFVRDNTPPKMTCPADQTVYADANCSGVVGARSPLSVSDNCTTTGLIAVAQIPPSSTVLSGHNDVRTVTLTATDGSANSANCSFSVTLKDTTPPAVVCKNITVNLQEVPFVGSQATIVANDVLFSGSDNCGAANFSVAPTLFTCAHLGINAVILTATDQQNNSRTCQANVTVKDVAPPKITCPVDQIVPADASCSGVVGAWTLVSKSDNCTPSASIGAVQSPVAATPLSGHNSARTVTFTATDGSGNSATCSFTVTLKDVTPPTVICKPATVVLNSAGTGSLITASVYQSGSDNCGTVNLVSVVPNTFSCGQLGVTTVTLTVNDGHGNTKTCNAQVSVIDTQKPVFTSVPANVTVQCNAVPIAGKATATDNCSVTVVYNGQTVTAGACPDSYILTRQWTATDGSGNSQTATQRVTVQDLQAPVFTSTPAAVTVECNNIPAVGVPIATDNCDAQVSITYNGQAVTAGACPDTYVLTRLWTAVDNCGNTRTATQRIAVRDLTKPVFTSVPAAVTLECSSPIPPVGTALATDNCDAAVTINYLGESTTNATCSGSYQFVRTWSATDNCGNSTLTSQTITVQDTHPPTFTSVPANLTVQCSDLFPPIGTATATDACGGYVQVLFQGQVRTDGNCLYNYTITRTWRAVDLCGNSATASQVITIQDTLGPTFNSPPPNLTVSCTQIPDIAVLTAQDNCGPGMTTFVGQTQGPGDCNTGYTITRIWTAVDLCGNVSTHTQVIVVAPPITFGGPSGPGGVIPDLNGYAPRPVLAAGGPGIQTFALAPNPARDEVLVSFELEQAGEATVLLFDALGRMALRKAFDGVAGPNRFRLDLSGVAAGLYVAQVRVEGQAAKSLKLVVEKR